MVSAHETTNRHQCLFCGSRFKNKNENERHQNSIHIRRYSWSCGAISGYHEAFYISQENPDDTDICGFCGEGFVRCGLNLSALAVRHLEDVHKLRKCEHSKKFYRADHFRQHLKLSHASRIGEWTVMLENTCMREN
jgi:hypothetical protein